MKILYIKLSWLIWRKLAREVGRRKIGPLFVEAAESPGGRKVQVELELEQFDRLYGEAEV
jgi:hypothetical protein